MHILQIPWAAWYGDKQHAIAFPDTWAVSVHAMRDRPRMPSAEIAAAMSSSVELEALARRLKGGDKAVAIAVDDLTRGIDCETTVCVTVVSESEVGSVLEHGRLQLVHVRGPAVGVDVEAVRLGVDRDDRRPGVGVDLRSELRRRAVRAVDDHGQSVEAGVDGLCEVAPVAVAGVQVGR